MKQDHSRGGVKRGFDALERRSALKARRFALSSLLAIVFLSGFGLNGFQRQAETDPCAFDSEFMVGVRPRSILPDDLAFIERLPGLQASTFEKLRAAVEAADATGAPLQRKFELERVVKTAAELLMVRIFFNPNDYPSCEEMLDREIQFYGSELIATAEMCPYVIQFQIMNRPNLIEARDMPLIEALPGFDAAMLDALRAALPIVSTTKLESAIGTGPQSFLLRLFFNLGGDTPCEHEAVLFEDLHIEVGADFWKWEIKLQEPIGSLWYVFDKDMNLVHTLGGRIVGARSRNLSGTFGGFIPAGEDGFAHLKAFNATGGVQWWPSKDTKFKIDR